MRQILLAGKYYELAPTSQIVKRAINPFKGKLGTAGGLEYSDFQNASLEEYHDFRNGIGKKRGAASLARLDFTEGIDFATEGQTVLGPLVTTAGSFGATPLKIIDFQDATYAIATDGTVKKWNTDTSAWDTKLAKLNDMEILLEDCEDAWNELTDPTGVTNTAETAEYKVGDACGKSVCTASAGTGLIATEAITEVDLSAYDVIELWVKSNIALASGDWQLMLDNTAECESPLKTLNIPALTAGEWTKVVLDLGDASALTAIKSIGLNQAVDKGAMTFLYDDIWAVKTSLMSSPLDMIVITDATDEYLIVASAVAALYTTDGENWIRIRDYISPTGHSDPDNQWTNEANAYDGDTSTYAYDSVALKSWGGFIELTHAAMWQGAVRFFTGGVSADITEVDIDAYYSGGWHDVYEGSFTQDAYITKYLPTAQVVTKIRFRFYNNHEGVARNAYLYDVDFLPAYGYLASYDKRLYAIATDGSAVGYSTAGDIDTYSGYFSLTGDFGTVYDLFEGKLLSDGTPALYFTGTKDSFTIDTVNHIAYPIEAAYPPLTYAGHKGMYWNANVWIATGYGILKVSPSMATFIGPDQDDGLPSGYQGYIYDMVAVNNWLVFCVNGGSSDKSSILKRNSSLGGNLQVYTTSAINKPITCLHYSPSSLYTNGRLWFGEGTDIKYMMFPDTTANVKQVSGYQHVNDSGYGKLPILRKLAAISKTALGVAAITKSCVDIDNEYIQVFYGLNGADPTTSLGTFLTSPRPTILTFGSGLGLEFYTIQLAIKLFRGSINTNSPELESLMFYYIPTPVTINGWIFIVECTDEDAEERIAEFEAIKATNTLVVFNPTGDPDKTDFNYNVKLTQMPMRFYVEEQGTRETKGVEIVVEQVFEG